MDAIVDENAAEPPVASYSEEVSLPLRVPNPGDPDEAAQALTDIPPPSLPSANGLKRSHRDVEQSDAGDDGEGRFIDSKRVKSNDGGRISAPGPSETST